MAKTTYKTDSYPYRVYTALLTQNGGDSLNETDNIPLTIGVTYMIKQNSILRGDFTNVGAPNNNDGTYFVATGTTPNVWGQDSVFYNTGAPVVTVLENTIGNIWFTYADIGNYIVNSDGLFTASIATFISGLEGSVGGGGGSPLGGGTGIYRVTDSLLFFTVIDNGGNPANNMIVGYPIEIRVYS
jgi:hypothetical protein